MFKDRSNLFPIVNRNLFDLYETQLKAFWTPYEIDFSEDVHDLKKLNENERHLILQILAFFAQSDAIVNENLAKRFSNDINIPEAIQFYSMQLGIEAIHGHTYGLMIDEYVKDEEYKNKLFNAIKNFPTIAKKAAWMRKWIFSQESFTKRLYAFALVEGVFFSGSFCAIYWLKEKTKAHKGLAMANQLISADEYLHMKFAGVLYKELLKMNNSIKSKTFYLNSRFEELSAEEIGKLHQEIHFTKKSMINGEFKPLTQEEVNEITKEAVALEKEFITESLPVQLLGINKDLMHQYIENQADLVSLEFGMDKIYNVNQPFDFMSKLDVRGKVNFFESRNDSYIKGVREKVNFSEINEDF
jgi:ribonucleoside-diphosphate reductase beta chain